MLRNNEDQYGWVTIVIHWLMAVVVLGMFAVGWYMVDLTYYDELYKTLPEIHKSIGILLVFVLLLRLVWRWSNPSPRPLSRKPLEIAGARYAHLLMYFLLGFIFASGYLISTAEGAPIYVFDWFSVPATITSIPEQEDIAGVIHEYLAYVLMALVAVHALAALKHHFVNRDNTLRRMLGISSAGPQTSFSIDNGAKNES